MDNRFRKSISELAGPSIASWHKAGIVPQILHICWSQGPVCQHDLATAKPPEALTESCSWCFTASKRMFLRSHLVGQPGAGVLSSVITIHTDLHANHPLLAQESRVSVRWHIWTDGRTSFEIRITSFWRNERLDPVVFYFGYRPWPCLAPCFLLHSSMCLR